MLSCSSAARYSAFAPSGQAQELDLGAARGQPAAVAQGTGPGFRRPGAHRWPEARRPRRNPFLADVRLNDLQLTAGLSGRRKIDAIDKALPNKLAGHGGGVVFDPIRAYVEYCIGHDAPAASVRAALARHYADRHWRPHVQSHQNPALQMVRQAAEARVERVITDVAAASQGSKRVGSRLFDALYPLCRPS